MVYGSTTKFLTMESTKYTTTSTHRIHSVLIAPDAHGDKLRDSLAWHMNGVQNALNLYARGTGNTTAALIARMIAAAAVVLERIKE